MKLVPMITPNNEEFKINDPKWESCFYHEKSIKTQISNHFISIFSQERVCMSHLLQREKIWQLLAVVIYENILLQPFSLMSC